MARGWGLGPVFAAEWLTTSRRWQVYAGRSLFVGVLLLGAVLQVWWGRAAGKTFTRVSDMAQVGRGCFDAIVFTQLTMVLLAAPAATAGVICQDKARGNLLHLFLTDLSAAEIVLGKLAAQLIPILGLSCCTLPVLALGGLLGGIDPLALAGSFLIALGVAILGCTLALTLSIWGSKPYEILLATCAVWVIWLLAVPVWDFFTWLRGFPPVPTWAFATNPLRLALAPYERPGTMDLVDYLAFLGATLVVSAVLAALAIKRIRAVVLAQAEHSAERRWPFRALSTRLGLLWEPTLDNHPALWYERHRRLRSGWMGALIGLYYFFFAIFSLLAIDDSVRPSTPHRGWFPAYVNAFQVGLGLPILLMGATTSLVEERVRGGLDVLLATPLSTRSIVLAKWWTGFRRAPALLILPALVASVLSWQKGNWPGVVLFVLYHAAAAAAWTSIGLALATWVPRPGRAVALATILYALITVAYPNLVENLFNFDSTGSRLSVLSPHYGAFYLTDCIEWPMMIEGRFRLGHLAGPPFMRPSLSNSPLLLTLATFDRCFGRV